MSRLSWVRCVALAMPALLASRPGAAGPTNAPIIGGQPATVGQFPAVVAIRVGSDLCTGTLIHPEWVLTAAHCIQGVAGTGVTVHFGTVNLGRSLGTQVTSAAVYPKPGFSSLGKNDIGLIKLSRAVTDVAPVPVNFVAAAAPVGIKVTMVGFGATQVGGGGSVGIEYVVEQTSVTCPAFAGTDADLLCFNQGSRTGKCQGDSGGPSFAMINGRMTQVGVTSFGDQDCAEFGADTRTDIERAFLLQYVPTLECATDADCASGRTCFLRQCIAQPFTDTGLGDTCTAAADCDSGTCASGDGASYCSMTCTVGDSATCPDGLDCIEAGTVGACWPSDGGGCCDASGANANSMLLGIALFGIVRGRRRR